MTPGPGFQAEGRVKESDSYNADDLLPRRELPGEADSYIVKAEQAERRAG